MEAAALPAPLGVDRLTGGGDWAASMSPVRTMGATNCASDSAATAVSRVLIGCCEVRSQSVYSLTICAEGEIERER